MDDSLTLSSLQHFLSLSFHTLFKIFSWCVFANFFSTRNLVWCIFYLGTLRLWSLPRVWVFQFLLRSVSAPAHTLYHPKIITFHWRRADGVCSRLPLSVHLNSPWRHGEVQIISPEQRTSQASPAVANRLWQSQCESWPYLSSGSPVSAQSEQRAFRLQWTSCGRAP